MHHPDTELIGYVTGELTGAERERVDAHLAGCAVCRREVDVLQQILTDLRASAPAPPEIHWGQWRAELRARVERHAQPRQWWRRPVPLVLSAGLAALLLAVVWLGGEREAPRPDLASIEETAIGGRLDLLRQFALVEQLDLIEDLEVISQLDTLAPQREG